MDHNTQQAPVAQVKNKSWQVVFANSSSMLGGACLIVSLYSRDQGVLLVPLCICFMGILCARTCWLIIQHMVSIDNSFTEMVQRLLGPRHKILAQYSSGIYFFIAIISNYLLACNLLFNVLTFIFQKTNFTNYGDKTHIDFGRFSYTYIVIIFGGIIYLCSFLKNLKIIIKLASYTFLSTFVFLSWIIYQFIKTASKGHLKDKNMHDKNDNNDGINVFKFNIQNIFEIFAVLATCLTSHSLGMTVFTQNENQNNNKRDLYLSYFVAVWIQVLIAIFGYLGIYGKYIKDEANTLFDYYTDSIEIPTFISLCFFFCQEIIFVILLLFETKKTFIIIINGYKKRSANTPIPIADKLFCIVTVLICLLLGVLNVSPALVIACAGAFGAYFVVFQFPALIHLACIYGKNFLTSTKQPFHNILQPQNNATEQQQQKDEILEVNQPNPKQEIELHEQHEKDLQSIERDKNLKEDHIQRKLEHETLKTQIVSPKQVQSPMMLMDPDHHQDKKEEVFCTHGKYITGISKGTRIFFNLSIIAFGLAILIFQIVSLIQSCF